MIREMPSYYIPLVRDEVARKLADDPKATCQGRQADNCEQCWKLNGINRNEWKASNLTSLRH